MLSRVFADKPPSWRRRTRSSEKGKHEKHHRSILSSLHPSNVDDDEDEGWCGLGKDLPLTFCGGRGAGSLGLGEVLRSSVQVLGMSALGITEKVVLSDGSTFTAKRFRRASVGRLEFGRRVERVASICDQCVYLVPVRAYLYAKRTKLVLCDYYPMGSLADLLAGARELGHTSLDWQKRAKIILHVAHALAFIHSRAPAIDDKRFRANVHGNVKPSNVIVGIDFSVRLSDYGFAQIAELVDSPSDRRSKKPTSPPLAAAEEYVVGKVSQKSDVFNFGLMVLDVVGGARAPHQIPCIVERMDEIRAGMVHFFEFFAGGRAKEQALRMLEVGLACTNRSPEARPSADQILSILTQALGVDQISEG